MQTRKLLLASGLLAASLGAQTGRTLVVTTPATLGGTAQIDFNHPLTAGGNYFEILGSAPNTNALNLGIPAVAGLFRLDFPTYFSWSNGFLAAATSTPITLPIANNISLVGAVVESQSADVNPTATMVFLGDNDVQLRIVLGICKLTMAQASSTSTITGNNVLHQIDDMSIGTPANLGVPAFACQVIRHRGQEGFVEGYAGTFSATPHNSDIDSLSHRRVAKRTMNGAYQMITLPNGYDISIVRSNANQNEFRVMSYNRATGVSTVVPGTTVVDTSAAPPTTATLLPYMVFSNDGTLGCVIVHDLNTTAPPPDRVLLFRTDASAPAIDVTATAPVSTAYFDGAQYFTNDFLIVVGSGGWYWTSVTAPGPLQPLSLPNTTASNAPPIWVFSFSWRVARDGSIAYFASGSNAAASRTEMELYRITNNAGTPLVANVTQFAAPTGLAEFGFSAITPSTANNSSNGIKCAVSPDGTQVAMLGATTTTTAFPGLYVWTGTPNPSLVTVPGATFYSEVTFLNDTTVLFFAGTSNTAQTLYKYDVNTTAVTAMTTASDIRTRGQWWSLNKHWWYFVRSNAASSKNNIVAVSRKTGAMKDITGTEFSAPSVPPRHEILTGSFNTTLDPWPMLEMQIRRAPVGDFAYFTARRVTNVAATFEDANVFRFDIENGGQAEMLTNNTTRGALAVIKQIESLAISDNGAHLAWAQRLDILATNSEDVIHFRTAANQLSVSAPGGQSITDGSIYFTCNPPNGLVWSIGTGSTTMPLANSRIEWAGLGTNTPIPISGPLVTTRLFQILGTFD